MSKQRYKVVLGPEERCELEQMVSKGKAAARKLTHARILLLTDESEGRKGRTDAEVAETLTVGPCTVFRVRQRWVTEGLEQAVNPRPQPPRPDKVKINQEVEPKLLELARSDPPEGRGGWTMQLLADQLVVLRMVDSVSDETVRKALKKTTSISGS